MPFYLVAGYKKGCVKMFDMRTMTNVATCNLSAPLVEFDVHRRLPFSVGISNNQLLSFSFENSNFTPEEQDMLNPMSFTLHQSESTCAVRSGSKIQAIVIDY